MVSIYKIKKEKTTQRVLRTEELIKYFSLNIPINSPKYKFWWIGQLLFMCRGINLRDTSIVITPNEEKKVAYFHRSEVKPSFFTKIHIFGSRKKMFLVNLKDENSWRFH